ncbi:MAG: Ig-like domain-containing protein [Actinomycetota bacterium]|nr:Ig-like domain-containing protein [Actinomycetota bacterium]
MSRLFATTALLCLLLVNAPATAQEEHDVVQASMISPADDDVLSEVVTLHGRASSPAGIRRAELLVDGLVVATVTPDDFKQEVEVTFDWDTRTTPDGSAASSNGSYLVAVRGITNGERAVDTDTISVLLDNYPQAPSGLQAEVKGDELRLTWEPNPEPDVVAYQVWRAQGKRFSLHREVDVTGFYEELEPGTYTYAIVALRSGPGENNARPSAASEPLSVVINRGPDGNSSFVVGGKEAGPKGLPVGIDLPSFGQAGLPKLPNLAAEAGSDSEGGYEKKLPYKVPKEFRVLGKPTDDRRRWWNAIPPDGLRWLAAGLLLLVVAAQARFIASRIVARPR